MAHADSIWQAEEGKMYLDVPVGQKQVDDDVSWKALYVVQSLLNTAELWGQLRPREQLPRFPELVENGFSEVLAVKGYRRDSERDIISH